MSRLVRPEGADADAGWLDEYRRRADLEEAWSVVDGCFACRWLALSAARDWPGIKALRRARARYGLGASPGGHTLGCERGVPLPAGTPPDPPSARQAKRLLDGACRGDREPLVEHVEHLDEHRRHGSA